MEIMLDTPHTMGLSQNSKTWNRIVHKDEADRAGYNEKKRKENNIIEKSFSQ